jgi:hypothetical protein
LSRQVSALVAFIEHPLVFDSKVWNDVYRLRPPHGTVARIANGLGTELHESCRDWKWESPSAFREELCTIRRWYRKSWKTGRYRHGPNAVFTKKVEGHYKRLENNVRFEGMWNWSEVASGMHGPGIAVPTGAVPVERLWSSLKGIFPVAERNMTQEWMELLLDLAFFRHNYTHFHSRGLPSWTHNDSVLASRMETHSGDFEHLLEEAIRKEAVAAGSTK